MLRTLRGVKEGWSRTRARLRDKVPVVSQVGERAEANAAAAEAGHGMQQKKKLVHVQQHASVYPRMVFVDVNGRAALSVDVRSPTFEAGVTANGRTVYRVGRGREHQGGIFVSFAHRRVEGSAQPDDLIDDDEDELKELEAAPVVEAAAEGEEEAGDYGNSNDASSVYGSHFDWDNRVTFRLQRWEIGELADFTPAETSLSCKRRADDGAVKHLSFTLGSQGNTEVVCAQSGIQLRWFYLLDTCLFFNVMPFLD